MSPLIIIFGLIITIIVIAGICKIFGNKYSDDEIIDLYKEDESIFNKENKNR